MVSSRHLPVSWSVESGEGILWSTPLPGLGHSAPVVWGDRVFLTTAVSGKEDPEPRVGLYGNIASPVAGDGKIYFTSEEGTIFVVRAGEEFELLGTNDMGGICMATPAISGGVLLIRTTKGVVAVGTVKKG